MAQQPIDLTNFKVSKTNPDFERNYIDRVLHALAAQQTPTTLIEAAEAAATAAVIAKAGGTGTVVANYVRAVLPGTGVTVDNTNVSYPIVSSSGEVSSSGDRTYAHTQGTASSTWTINHNLGKFPAITVRDSSGKEVIGDYTHTNNVQVIASFSTAFAGKASAN